VTFDDSPPPPGADSWVGGTSRAVGIEIAEPDPGWPRQYDDIAARIRQALGWRALQLEHVGSTSVPGLAAKPIIDIDLTVADPGREADYVPALERIGFRLVIREPWWYGHRALRLDTPLCNLHVFGFDSPELVRHRIFRDWLTGNPAERDRYAAVKREAAAAANARGEHVMQYNARKQQVIREIYRRAFAAAGLLEPSPPGQDAPVVALRPVEDSDLDALFDQMRDPASVLMAAFTAENPGDRDAFDAHMAKVRSSPDITMRAVTCDGRLVGSIASFVSEGQREVTYWIEREAWGRGIATRAMALLLDLVRTRPLHARAASDNAGSLRVLRKSGFKVIGTETSFATARKDEIEETILRLD
jgi:GrpB-like predicted nucleotidyltransferase (UPF0157 family)/RimJ/RimL family protein N-acetyltransferase